MALRYPDAPPRRRTGRSTDALTTGLGLFSIGLGAVQLAFPHAVARCLGANDRGAVMRAYGAREVATGIGILSSDDPRPWVWARVGGDILDLATLGLGLSRRNPQRPYVGAAMAAVAAVTVLDFLCANALEQAERGPYVAPDFSDRSGFPKPPARMRAAAPADGHPASDPSTSPRASGGLP